MVFSLRIILRMGWAASEQCVALVSVHGANNRMVHFEGVIEGVRPIFRSWRTLQIAFLGRKMRQTPGA